MAWYKVYAGMSGGFGGATFQGTYEFASEDEALKAAYCLAEEEYQSYEGSHGILSYEDVEQDLRDSGFIDEDLTENEIEDMIACRYLEEIESWIEYCVRPAASEHDIDDE